MKNRVSTEFLALVVCDISKKQKNGLRIDELNTLRQLITPLKSVKNKNFGSSLTNTSVFVTSSLISRDKVIKVQYYWEAAEIYKHQH